MKTEAKICPKCGKQFECNNYNILKCDCARVSLNAAARQLISEKYDDCLCLNCLREFSEQTVEKKKDNGMS